MKTGSKLLVSTALGFVGGFVSAVMLKSEAGRRTFRNLSEGTHQAADRVRHALQELEDSYVPTLPDNWSLSDNDVLFTLGNAVR